MSFLTLRECRAEKTPSRSHASGGGFSIRAAWTLTHTARLLVGRRIHRSAPHCQGYCAIHSPTLHGESSHLRLICIYVSQPRGCREAQHAPVLRGRVCGHEECLHPADRLGTEADLATGEQMDDRGERFVLIGRNVAHRLNEIAKSQGPGLGTSHRMCLLASLSAGRSALRSGVWSRVSI